MKCNLCGKEYESKRATSKYCSNRCKQAGYRNTAEPVTVTPDESVTLKPVTLTDLTSLTAKQLYQALDNKRINAEWVNSPEHKELMRRINTMSIQELEDTGHYVPARKRTA